MPPKLLFTIQEVNLQACPLVIITKLLECGIPLRRCIYAGEHCYFFISSYRWGKTRRDTIVNSV